MAIKQSNHIIKGLRQDYSPSKASPEYAVDAMNIRLTANDKDSLLSITCEKNPDKKHTFEIKADSAYFSYNKIKILGYSNIDNTIILFSKVYYSLTNKVLISLKSYIEEFPRYYTKLKAKTQYTIAEAKTIKDLITEYHLLSHILYEEKLNLLDKVKEIRDAINIIVVALDDTIRNSNYYGGPSYESWEYDLTEVPNFGEGYQDQGTMLNLFHEHGEDYINFVDTINLEDANLANYIDTILKIKDFEVDILYKGDLNFPEEGTIDCLASYENKEVQKVYWVDGVNQPRVINIAATDEVKGTWNDKSFDFIKDLKLEETFEVEKTYDAGQFEPGVIQYCYTYFNKYAGESNIVDVSPLYYINDRGKGNAPDDIVKYNCFKITITNTDNSFDFIRVYSIHRTSLDAQPVVKVVKDIKREDEVSCIDNGLIGYTTDPTELLYKGGEYIIPKTIAQKDGTLFLGNFNIKEEESKINTEAKDFIKNINGASIVWRTKEISLKSDSGDLYPRIEPEDNNESFRTFKRLETYRIGVQCQTETGKWLNPIFIEDSVVKGGDEGFAINPKYELIQTEGDNQQSKVTTIRGVIKLDENVVNYFNNNKIKRCRPVVVFPDDSNREILTQGILNPTVFNTRQKYNNQFDAQCSWIFRPDVYKTNYNLSFPQDRVKEIIIDDNTKINNNTSIYYRGKYSYYGGAWPEHKHYILLPPNYSPLAELPHMQYTYGITDSDFYVNPISNNAPTYDGTLTLNNNYYNQSALGRSTGFTIDGENGKTNIYNPELKEGELDYYAVDKNIVTMHSPELEKLTVTEVEGLKLRIVGIVLFSRCIKDINQQFESATLSTIGSPVNSINHSTKEQNGSGMLLSGKYIKYVNGSDEKSDELNVLYTDKIKFYNYLFDPGVYPIEKANIEKQYIANMLIPRGTFYFSKNGNEFYNIATSDIKVFKGVGSGLSLKSPKNAIWHKKRNYMYKGNVDDPLTSFKTQKFDFWLGGYRSDTDISWNKVLEDSSLRYLYTASYAEDSYTKTYALTYDVDKDNDDKRDIHASNNPIVMSYKNTPHAVAVFEHEHLDEEDFSRKLLLPTLIKNTNDISLLENNKNIVEKSNNKYKDWDGTISYSHPFLITSDYFGWGTDNLVTNDGYHYLWLAELYREVTNKFGEEDSTDNLWVPAGKSVQIPNEGPLNLSIEYGDTFFTRYDCLKTFSNNQKCNLVDIASFFVETRLNTDLRYDSNKGNTSNLYVDDTNYNKLNDVYNQKDNFFNYRVQDKDITKNIYFPHAITWSSKKIVGNKIDVWTNITLGAVLEDFEGTKGDIVKIYPFRDELYVFQPKAISRILFNTRALLNTSDGIPITIGNNYNLEGIKKISDIGSSHINSINDNTSYLYFTDPLTKGIYRFNGEVAEPMSTKLNMSMWAKDNINNDTCVYVDHTNMNIYFQTYDNSKGKKVSLGYSELLGEFESFYSYDSPIIRTDTTSLMLENSNAYINIYELYPNTVNRSTLNDLEESYITILSNGGSLSDKIFTTLDFSAEDNSTESAIKEPLTQVEITTGNMSTKEELTYSKYGSSNLKKRFNIWRMNLPRLNRKWFRYPWAKIKLTLNRNSNPEIHNFTVNYLE